MQPSNFLTPDSELQTGQKTRTDQIRISASQPETTATALGALVCGKDNGQREGQWSAGKTVVSGKDSGQRQGQWSAERTVGRTVVSCKDSGQREGQWTAAMTVDSGKGSGQLQG